jgi:two-component system, chemotaxis family, protein-glutamate methylesterase/glutaminase
MNTLNERPLRILAADDSAVMRGIMWKLFLMHAQDRRSELPRMELCGVAQDGVECLESVKRLNPDVLVLDLEMPRLNGLDVLDRLQKESPELPVIMCSSYTEFGARSTLEALARGASDYVTKPTQQRDFEMAMLSLSQQLLPRIAALAKGVNRRAESGPALRLGPQRIKGGEVSARSSAPIEMVVIGLSTGGPAALEQLLPRLSKDFPVPVMIVQHMPKLFTGALAERLDRCCALHVEEAYDEAIVRPGTVWLAPGDSHMEISARRTMPGDEDRKAGMRGGKIRLHRQEPLNHCRPSVDYLFFSAAQMYGAGALALVMTGMGADGLDGAHAVHKSGGVVLAQDEASSAVWGMPGRVSEAGIASATLPLVSIAAALTQRVGASRATTANPDARGLAAEARRREVTYGLY